MQGEFDRYIEKVKNKTLDEKQKLLFKQLTSIALLVNDELMNIMKNDYNDDEYITALMALSSSIQESLCDFDEKISDIIEGTIE